MKIEGIITLLAALRSEVAANAGMGRIDFYNDKIKEATISLQRIEELKKQLRMKFETDKLVELYETIEGTK